MSKRKKKDEGEEGQKVVKFDASRFHISGAAAARGIENDNVKQPNRPNSKEESNKEEGLLFEEQDGFKASSSGLQVKSQDSSFNLKENPSDLDEKKSVETLLAATTSNTFELANGEGVVRKIIKEKLDAGVAVVVADNNAKRRKSTRASRYKGTYNLEAISAGAEATAEESLSPSSSKKARVPPQPASVAQYKNLQQPNPKQAGSSYLSQKHTSSRNDPIDDEDGHLIININSILSPRYTIVGLLGQGTFGKVVEAWDQVLQKKCAIKIIKAIQKYSDAAQVEIKVLKKLKQSDPYMERGCIHLNDYFLYRGHICMVFDLLSQSLFDFFQEAKFAPFSIRQIQSFAQQLVNSIVFLHDLRYIHTDLKPENLMLVDKKKVDVPVQNSRRPRKMLKDTRIVLIDFGSTIAQDDYHSSVVSTRHYRAPEILLDLGWSFPCDIWSIGCILVELYTGVALFQTHDNLEHLRMMEIILGPFPRSLIKHLSEKNRFYFESNRVNYPIPNTEKSSIQYLDTLQSIENIIRPRNEFEVLFLDFCRSLLRFHPDDRITARQAQQHAFLNF